MKRLVNIYALPWLIACVHANSWADPMRPLIPPNPSADAAPAAPARTARPQDPEGSREPDRLVAIRQDSASRWQALFGERWVGPGDRIENYTVAGIESNAVHLLDGRRQRVLHLLPPLWRPNQPSGPPGAAVSAPSAPSAQSAQSARSTDLAQAIAATATAAPSTQRAQGLPPP